MSVISRLKTAFLYCSSTVRIFLSILEHYKEPNKPLQAVIVLNKAQETCHRIQMIEVIHVLQWIILKNWPSLVSRVKELKPRPTHTQAVWFPYVEKSSQCAERDDYGKSVDFRLTYNTATHRKMTAPVGVQHFYSQNPCSLMHAEWTGTSHPVVTKRFSWHDAKQTVLRRKLSCRCVEAPV